MIYFKIFFNTCIIIVLLQLFYCLCLLYCMELPSHIYQLIFYRNSSCPFIWWHSPQGCSFYQRPMVYSQWLNCTIILPSLPGRLRYTPLHFHYLLITICNVFHTCYSLTQWVRIGVESYSVRKFLGLTPNNMDHKSAVAPSVSWILFICRTKWRSHFTVTSA